MHLLLLSSLLISGYCSTRDTLTVFDPKHPGKQVISDEDREWRRAAIAALWKERQAMGHTPMVKVDLPGFPQTSLWLKNETASASGSLKHRFAWALMMWAVSEGKVRRGTVVIEATSGNTGASEAYMARLIGARFICVISNKLEQAKRDNIAQYGAELVPVPGSRCKEEAQRIAREENGFFMNQFGNADRAEEFHESGSHHMESSNVMHEVVNDLGMEPDYFIHAAGTGGTISSAARYAIRHNLETRIVLADSQYSLFYDYVTGEKFTSHDGHVHWRSPGVAGTGFGYDKSVVEFGRTTSLVRALIDIAVKIPDIATAAAMRVLRERGVGGGASTAMNFMAALWRATQHEPTEPLTIATIMGDPAFFYEKTYFNDTHMDISFRHLGGMAAVDCWKGVIADSIDHGTEFFVRGSTECEHTDFSGPQRIPRTRKVGFAADKNEKKVKRSTSHSKASRHSRSNRQ